LIVAVVLAAGQSKRMGKPKQTLLLGGVPMLQKVLEVYRQTDVDRIVVVLGAGAGAVRRAVHFKEQVVVNRGYRRGMSGSLKLGIAAAPGADAVIVALGDQPFVSPRTVNKLIDAYRKSGARAVVPVYRGTRGNPVLLDRSLFPEIEKITGDVGGKSVIAGNEASVLEVSVRDKGVASDLDTPRDYREATSRRPGPGKV
jgi:molybdenum cofactor cytidylyltransferase